MSNTGGAIPLVTVRRSQRVQVRASRHGENCVACFGSTNTAPLTALSSCCFIPGVSANNTLLQERAQATFEMKFCSFAVAAVVAAALLAPLFQRMPAPFDDTVAVDIPLERQELYPGGANGSTIPAALNGAFSPNDRLRAAKRLFEGQVFGSESVAMHGTSLLMIDRGGYVHRAVPTNAPADGLDYELRGPPLYIGPGRPLGFHVSGDTLLVCDSLKGLLRVDLTSGTIEVLANAVDTPEGTSEPLLYANDLDVAKVSLTLTLTLTLTPLP